jgi:predicted dienelactone hydrolase
MRLLEIALVVLVALSAFVAFNRRTPRRLLLWLCIADLLMLVAHAIVEGPHWQMAPAYLAALLFPALLAVRPMLLRRTMAALMLVLLLGACTASAILPMFRLPAPTGPYLIGTRIFHLVDDHPSDPSSAGPDGKRQLMIQVWYPASPSHAPRAPYRKLAETTLMSSYQAVLWTHSRWNAPLAQHGAPFPLLLLNPAWNGRRTYYMYLVEDLVSHGYIVAGIDHTGNSGPTAFPDGHVSQPDPDPGLDFGIHTFPELIAYGTQQLEVQVNDTRFVLDQLQGWNQDEASPFYQRIDMDRVGALGHSVGGAVAAQACLEDSRIKSALDMDGSLWGQVQAVGLNKPFLMIEEDIQHPTPQQIQQDHVAMIDDLLDKGDLAMMEKSNAYRITLHGSTHSSFSDRSLFSPLRDRSGVGTIPAEREYLIIRSYALAFFDKTLRGENPALLNGTDRTYPEATLEILHKP